MNQQWIKVINGEVYISAENAEYMEKFVIHAYDQIKRDCPIRLMYHACPVSADQCKHCTVYVGKSVLKV